MDPGQSYLVGAAGLASIGTLLSWFLYRQGRREGNLPGCGTTSDCGGVLTSRWARWGSVPVSGVGVLLYLMLAATALLVACGAPNMVRNGSGAVLVAGTTLAVCGGLWFGLLQVLVLRRFCLYCNAVHACGAGVATLVFLGLRYGEAPDPLRTLPCPASQLVGASLLASGLMVASQILLRPRMYQLTESSALPPLPEAAVPRASGVSPPPSGPLAGASGTALSAGPTREVVLLGGRVRLSVEDWPRLGAPDAQHLLALLFDPTCRDCHQLYRILCHAVQQRPHELAVLVVPIPLDPACNPLIAQASAKSTGACEQTRLLWILWRSGPDTWNQFNTWAATQSHPIPVAAVRQQAQGLLGAEVLARAAADLALDQRIRHAFGIYQSLPHRVLPQVLLPRGVIQGQIPTLEQFQHIFEHHVGLVTLGRS